MNPAYEAIYQKIYTKLTPTSQTELAGKREKFETLISEIQGRNPESVDLMKLLAAYSQTRFEGMSDKLISEIKQAAEQSSKQSAGKRKKTYKRSSTKKSKSRRNKTRK
jgi:hypothetical protein